MSPAAAGASDARIERWLAEQRWFARRDGEATPTVDGVVRAPVKKGVAISLLAVGDDRYQLVPSGGGPDAADDPAVAGALVTK